MSKQPVSTMLGAATHRSESITHPGTGRPIRVSFSEARWNLRDNWGADHWDYKVLVTYQGRSLTILYSTGSAWERDALHAKDVITTLIDDCRFDIDNLADFMGEYGYDDEQEAGRIFKAVSRQNAAMRRVFADDLDSLIENWEE